LDFASTTAEALCFSVELDRDEVVDEVVDGVRFLTATTGLATSSWVVVDEYGFDTSMPFSSFGPPPLVTASGFCCCFFFDSTFGEGLLEDDDDDDDDDDDTLASLKRRLGSSRGLSRLRSRLSRLSL
jgi:hypothetical protein